MVVAFDGECHAGEVVVGVVEAHKGVVTQAGQWVGLGVEMLTHLCEKQVDIQLHQQLQQGYFEHLRTLGAPGIFLDNILHAEYVK